MAAVGATSSPLCRRSTELGRIWHMAELVLRSYATLRGTNGKKPTLTATIDNLISNTLHSPTLCSHLRELID